MNLALKKTYQQFPILITVSSLQVKVNSKFAAMGVNDCFSSV